MTFGPAPKASQVSQNWCSLAPQVDLEQQLGHLLQVGQNSSDQHRKHLSHMLFSDDEQHLDLRLFCVATLLQ